MLHIKLNEIANAVTWSQIFCLQTAATPGLGSKGQNSAISKHGHVAFQIKGNHECSDIVANIWLGPPPS